MRGIPAGIRSYMPPSIKRAIMEASRLPRFLTSQMRALPDFIIIGAQRGGTTSFYNYLVQHPCVVPALRKEISFFDNNFRKGINWYRSHFLSLPYRYCFKQLYGQDLVTGEASPDYLLHPHAPRRISTVLPTAKLIVMMRNPVDRAYSSHYSKVKLGKETLSFEDAIEQEQERLHGEVEKMLEDEDYFSFNHRHYSYLAKGIYVDQLRTWMSLFPREQFLIIKSEDFYEDHRKILERTLDFLGLPDWEPEETDYTRLNVSGYPEMNADTRKRLADYFRPHNQRLNEYLAGISCRTMDWE